MAKFCTACGTRNDNEALFCEECGNGLRGVPSPPIVPTQLPAAGEEPAARTASAPARRSWLVAAALGVVAMGVAVGGFAWWSSSPAASAKAFASALQGPSGSGAAPSADLLCLANLPFDRPQINVGERDVKTRRWMDALATAGLYTAGSPNEGLFGPSIPYTPTPELDNWRRGARLCVARSWAVGEVKGGRFIPETRGGRTISRASVVWKAEGTASWLTRLPPGQWLPGIKADGGSLTIESSQLFELRDRHWIAVTVADRHEVQPDVVQAAGRGPNSGTKSAHQNGIFAAVKNLVGARKKLDGTYADSLGAIKFTFKDDGTMLVSIMRHEAQCGCSYEVDGDTVKLLTPYGGVLVLTLLQDGSLKGVNMPGYPPGMIFTKQQSASSGGRDAGGKTAARGTGAVAANLSGVEAEARDAAVAEIARHWSKGPDGWTTVLIEQPFAPRRFLRQFREMTVETVEPIDVSAADRLNGVEWIGSVSIGTGPCREAGDPGVAFYSLGITYVSMGIDRRRGTWTQWVDVHPQPLDVSRVKGLWHVQPGQLSMLSEPVKKGTQDPAHDLASRVYGPQVTLLRGKPPTWEDFQSAGVR